MTASDLHETLKPIMGRGVLPEWLAFDTEGKWTEFFPTFYLSPHSVELIAEAAMVRWLVSKGLAPQIVRSTIGRSVFGGMNHNRLGFGKDEAAALVAACVAVLEETK